MPTATTPTPPDELGPAPAAVLALAERWAEAAKAQAIYPAGHHRVSAALETLGGELTQARAALPGVTLQIVFTGQGVRVHDTEVPLEPEGGLAWLRERLEHGGLAGIALGEAAGAHSLAAVNQRLLAHYARRDPITDVAQAWSDGDWPGVSLLDRRFEGVFDGEDPATKRDTQRTWAGRGTDNRRDPRHARLVAELLEDPVLVERLRAMGEADGGGEQALAPREVLERIAALVPLEGQADGRALRVVQQIVETLETRAEGRLSRLDLASQLEDPELGRRAAWLCGIMVRQDIGAEKATQAREAPAQGPQGHAGDEKFQEDDEGFLRELAQLPAMGPPGPLESPVESLAALLHLLGSVEGAAEAVTLREALAANLAAPDREQLQALGNVLRAASQRADADTLNAPLTRLLDVLRACGLGALVRRCGFLSSDRVAETFPTCFGDWLASLDLDQPGDRSELGQVLGAIGASRIAAAADALHSPTQLRRPGLAQRLLAHPVPALAPLAARWLTGFGGEARAAAVGWLKSLRLKDPVAQVLALVEDPGTLPDILLQGLMELACGRPVPEEAQRAAVRATTEFVRSAAGRPDRRARRLDALRLLGGYEAPEADALLDEVVHARRWWVVPVEDRLTRQVAAAALKGRGAA
jgi:hypothetical protein